jgi:hypothetical protein
VRGELKVARRSGSSRESRSSGWCFQLAPVLARERLDAEQMLLGIQRTRAPAAHRGG